MPRLADQTVRTELLRAAEAEFAERGLAAAKVETITARAGVSKGAFYLHFRGKEDCFRLIVEDFLARFAACARPPFDPQAELPATLQDLVARVLPRNVAILEFCWQSRGLLRMLLEGGGGTPHAYLVAEFRERARAQAEEWIRRAMEQGLYRGDIDPRVTSALMSGAHERLVQDLIRQQERPDIEAWCRQVIDLFTQGLLARPRAQAGRQDAASLSRSAEAR